MVPHLRLQVEPVPATSHERVLAMRTPPHLRDADRRPPPTHLLREATPPHETRRLHRLWRRVPQSRKAVPPLPQPLERNPMNDATPDRVQRIYVSREMADDKPFIESMEAEPTIELVWPVGEWVWDYEDELIRRANEATRS
jgi:hypothetical protein